MKVLLAEDNEVQSGPLYKLLREAGLEVVVVKNGLKALQLLSSSDFDLVISDITMPTVDGLQLLNETRKDSQVPFILYSSDPNKEDKEFAYELGVTQYVEEAGIRGVMPAVIKILNLKT